MPKMCPEYESLKKQLKNIELALQTKKGMSKATRADVLIIKQSIQKKMAQLEQSAEWAEKSVTEERERICAAIKFFIENWEKYDVDYLNIVLNTIQKDDELKDFLLKWDSLTLQDTYSPYNKVMKLKEWLESRFDIYDFCNFPEALLDLKKEYVNLRNDNFREWTLKKFIECYKEFLCKEIRKICLYEQQEVYPYVQEKIKATGLGQYSPYLEYRCFDSFVDIAIDEDILEDNLPEILENDDTPDYLRPKCILRNFRRKV